MKKLLTILLALAMAASLAACSGGDKDKESTQTNNESTATDLTQGADKGDAFNGVIDLTGKPLTLGMTLYDGDEYSVTLSELPFEENLDGETYINVGCDFINKTDKPVYTDQHYFENMKDHVVAAGETYPDIQGESKADIENNGYMVLFFNPVDSDGNAMQSLEIYLSYGETNETVFVDNDLVKVVYNGVKTPHRANLSVTNKSDTMVKINRETMDLPRGMTETYDEAYEENGDGTATVWVQVTDMSDSKVVEKGATSESYMHYQYTVTFSLEDGHVINMEEMSKY